MDGLHSTLNLLGQMRPVVGMHMSMDGSSSKAKKYDMNKLCNPFVIIWFIEVDIPEMHRNMNPLDRFEPLVDGGLML